MISHARLVIVLAGATAMTAAVPATHAIDLTWHSIDAGGGTSTAGDLQLTGTIAQPEASTSSVADLQLQGGFWSAMGPPTPPCTGDTNGDGEVDVNDLVAVITDWGTDGSGNNADVDGSGVVSVDDLVAVISAWGACP